MSIGNLFGFDEVLGAIVAAYPEVKLHVSRADNELFATAASGDLVAIKTGKAGESAGLVVREALSDLRARLVARDSQVAQAAQALVVSEEEQERLRKLARLEELDDLINDQVDVVQLAIDKVAECSFDDFDTASKELRSAKMVLNELEQEALKLAAEVRATEGDEDDEDDEDFDDVDDDDVDDEF